MSGIIRYNSTSTRNVTGWRRLIGCLKLQVIFRKRATNYRALLRKMTCKDKASYDSIPSCTLYSSLHLNDSCFHIATHCLTLPHEIQVTATLESWVASEFPSVAPVLAKSAAKTVSENLWSIAKKSLPAFSPRSTCGV